jgi:hypothetical protein
MEKKQVKKAPAPKKKAAPKSAPKKKVVKKVKDVELPIIAPEATPFVAHRDEIVAEVKSSSLWSKIKSFLGF